MAPVLIAGVETEVCSGIIDGPSPVIQYVILDIGPLEDIGAQVFCHTVFGQDQDLCLAGPAGFDPVKSLILVVSNYRHLKTGQPGGRIGPVGDILAFLIASGLV